MIGPSHVGSGGATNAAPRPSPSPTATTIVGGGDTYCAEHEPRGGDQSRRGAFAIRMATTSNTRGS